MSGGDWEGQYKAADSYMTAGDLTGINEWGGDKWQQCNDNEMKKWAGSGGQTTDNGRCKQTKGGMIGEKERF